MLTRDAVNKIITRMLERVLFDGRDPIEQIEIAVNSYESLLSRELTTEERISLFTKLANLVMKEMNK